MGARGNKKETCLRACFFNLEMRDVIFLNLIRNVYSLCMKPPRLTVFITGMVFVSCLTQQIAQAAVIPSSVIKSTVFILGVSDDGSRIGRASGVIISSKGDVATNKHVVEDEFGFSITKLLVVPTNADETLDYKCAWVPTEYVPSSDYDLAVLLAPKKLPCQVSYLSPATDLPPTGTDINILGYPAIGQQFFGEGSLNLTTIGGMISGKQGQGSNVSYLKTDAKILSGNSGGPAVDDKNRLIGLAAATTTTNTGDDEFIGLIVPATHIASLISLPTGSQYTSGSLPADVDSAAWYASIIGEFVTAELIPTNIPFRPGDMATRSEFIDLLVRSKGGANGQYQSQSFTDVPFTASYFAAFEEAGLNGWVKGSNDCYGQKPCYAKPADRVNRAEAAALLNRAFGVSRLGVAPAFNDNPSNAWYFEEIQKAADNCVLKGDGDTGMVRPGDSMNRAEMVAMISRITKGQTYGNGCGVSGATNVRKPTVKSPANIETINDQSKSPINACKTMNASYDSNLGYCVCGSGMTWNKAITMCISLDAGCKERDANAEWDPVRETCQCGGDTEPSSDGKSCVISCEATYGYASYRTSSGQCTCLSGYFLKNGQCQMQPYCAGGTFNASSGTCNCSNGYYEKDDGSCGVTPFCGDGYFDDNSETCVCTGSATLKAGGYCSKY